MIDVLLKVVLLKISLDELLKTHSLLTPNVKEGWQFLGNTGIPLYSRACMLDMASGSTTMRAAGTTKRRRSESQLLQDTTNCATPSKRSSYFKAEQSKKNK